MEKKNKLIIIAAVAGVALLIGILIGIGLSSFLKNDTTAKTDVTEPSVIAQTEQQETELSEEEVKTDASTVDDESNQSDDKAAKTDAEDTSSNVTDEATTEETTTEEAKDEVTSVTWPSSKTKIPYSAANKMTLADESGQYVKYEIIEDDIAWSDAFKDCISRGGHLLVINDMDEYNKISEFIFKEKCDNDIFYLGAMRDVKGDKYYWVNENKEPINAKEPLNGNKSWCASLWAVGEPSFVDNHENEEIMLTTYYSKSDEKWLWSDNVDDLPGNANTYIGRTAYICEYE